MSILVRQSLESDLAAVTAIYAHAVEHGTASFELDPPDTAEMARRRAALVAADYPFLVAERNGAILGYAYAGPFRPRPAYRSTVEDSVYVSPAAQGTEVGRVLLAQLLKDCELRDFRLMIAVIGDAASDRSIGLHRSLGFEMVGVLPDVGYKHGRWLASVLMHRTLGPGSDTPPTRVAP